MRGKVFVLLSLAIFSAQFAVGQQDGTYTQYMFTPFAYNPASVSSDNLAHVFGLGRLHQQNIDAEDQHLVGGVSFPFNISKVKNGFGILISDDKFANSKNSTIKGNYALQLRLDDKGINNLGIGVGVGVINGVFDPSQKSGGTTTQNNLPTTKVTSTSLDVDAGVYFTSTRFHFGASVTHLNQPKLKLDKITIKTKPTLYVTSGYMAPIADSKFSFCPSFLMQTEFSTTQLSLSALFDYNNIVWAGVGYRINDAISGIVGFKLLKHLQMGYSYDYITSDLGKFSKGSHEVFLNYSFSLKRDRTPASYKSIRFL